MKTVLKLCAAGLVASAALSAHAELKIGVILSLTGPASGLGIPVNNGFKMWPDTIAGEKLKVIVLDDATDPTTGVKNARRLVTEDKVDVIMGSSTTPIVGGDGRRRRSESETLQITISPPPLPPEKEKWTFRMPLARPDAHAMVGHMKKQGVKTVGFLGYIDAYGESWLKDTTPIAERAGMKIIAIERFARTDTSVTGQALKLVAGEPGRDPDRRVGQRAPRCRTSALVERGYKGKIYQTDGGRLARPDARRRQGCRRRFRRLRPGHRGRAVARQPPVEAGRARLRAEVREGLRRRHAQPVRGPRVRRARWCCRRSCRWR